MGAYRSVRRLFASVRSRHLQACIGMKDSIYVLNDSSPVFSLLLAHEGVVMLITN